VYRDRRRGHGAPAALSDAGPLPRGLGCTSGRPCNSAGRAAHPRKTKEPRIGVPGVAAPATGPAPAAATRGPISGGEVCVQEAGRVWLKARVDGGCSGV
jgi:hypothetical protein